MKRERLPFYKVSALFLVHISNSVEIWEIGKFLKKVKINQEMIKKVKKKPNHLEAIR